MRRLMALVAALLVAITVVSPAAAHDDGSEFPTRRDPTIETALSFELPAFEALASTFCVDGDAAGYACSNVDLLSFTPLAAMGEGSGNDIWGWTDSLTDREYALMGRTSGTSFVDISDPVNPIYLGDLPTATVNSAWRDVKTSGDHAFIVSEAAGHGMQVFDLTRLRDVVDPPVTFDADAWYTAFGNAHNIGITDGVPTAIAVGTNTCAGGLHIIDLSTPTSPTFSACFSDDGYTHDVVCEIYSGPDTAHTGAEICIASNEDTVAIIDIGDPSNISLLSNTGYRRSGYTHQAVFTEDQTHILVDDELDELNRGVKTTTYVWDVSDLDQPFVVGTSVGSTSAIDHNQYVKGNHTYQANYRAGLRIFELTDLGAATLTEVGYFDVYQGSDAAAFNGAWSTYPYFDSGVVIVSGIEQGLYVLQPNLDEGPPPPEGGAHVGDLDASAVSGLRGRWTATVTVTVHDEAEAAVEGVTLTGTWGAGWATTCITGADGSCDLVQSRLRSTQMSVDFNVTDVSGGYDATANHDPGGDSDGTTITVFQP